MRSHEFITEKEDLSQLKHSVAGKIVNLPDTPPVEKTLGEIEDILTHVHAGGRMTMVRGELIKIDDPQVAKAHKLLAKYIMSIEMTPAQRDELFKLWKEDKLVDRKKLLSGKLEPIANIFTGYTKNAAIKEFVDDLSGIAALGQGKGEFLLSVLSKGIHKMGKGDLSIDGKAVEVKTLDKGAGRFFDRDVKPANTYLTNKDQFVKKYGNLLGAKPKSGWKLQDMCELSDVVKDKKAYEKDVNSIFDSLFPGQDTKKLVSLVLKGGTSIGPAKQEYAQLNMRFYIDVKKKAEALDGILYIDLSGNIMSMIYFKDFDDLAKEGLRLHAKTTYPITDDPQNAYPQITIMPTKGVSGVASPPIAAPEKSVAKPVSAPKAKATPAQVSKPKPAPKPAIRAKKL